MRTVKDGDPDKLLVVASIDQSTHDVMLKIRHRPTPVVYRGSRERFFELIGECGCVQPADKQLMLIYEFNPRTRDIVGQALCSQLPSGVWKCITVLPNYSAGLPFTRVERIDESTVAVTTRNGLVRTFQLVRRIEGLRWKEQS